MSTVPDLKDAVRQHWEREPCGTRGVDDGERRKFFQQIEEERYSWEPYIRSFARFDRARGKRFLEIGVGAGSDFMNWVRNGAVATGVDLTEHGVALTKERLALEGLTADVRQADAEALPFADDSFDVVYSYGVLHHSPNTPQAIREVHRVLKPGGTAIVMIYHAWSWVGFMLWGIYCAGRLQPWRSPRWAMYHHLESPGTKSYTVREARELFEMFSHVEARTQLSHGDLLMMPAAAKHQSPLRSLAWRLYPRALIRKTGDVFGTCLFVEATK